MIKEFFEILVKDYNLPGFMANYLLIGIYLFLFILVCVRAFRFIARQIKKKRIKKITDRDLHPFFTNEEIYNYTKLYIPQYYQNIAPSEGEEPGKIYAAAARSKLMSEFIKKGLLSNSPIKYFIILSDTGMGKTAFLINLYIKYNRRRPRGVNRIKYDMKLIPLGASDALERVKKIKNKEKTILLLDAFDEDINAINNYKERMSEILVQVKDFRKVIFTCRTQFFPTKDEEPSDTDDITFGENVKHSIHKLYLSTFDNKDILKYLFKKYGFKLIRFFRAYRLVKKSPSLMFRPMLLSYIDDLISQRSFYNFTFEMYNSLIENWITRESRKPAIVDKYGSDIYATDLLKFSRELAINLYEERTERNGYFITIPQLTVLISKKMITPDVLSIEDKTGRSLLNRNSAGHYKFSHKSILEYLLALEVFENPSFFNRFDFIGMDATYDFHQEMISQYLSNLTGEFYLKNDLKAKPLGSFHPRHLSLLEEVVVINSCDLEFQKLSGLSHPKKIIFVDNSYLIVYMLYVFVCFEGRLKQSTLSGNRQTFIAHVNKYRTEMNRIKSLQPNLDFQRIKVVIDECPMDDKARTLFNKLLISGSTGNENISVDDFLTLRELRNHVCSEISENVVLNNGFKDLARIQKLATSLKDTSVFY